MDHVSYSPPPLTRKHILFLNKNMSLIGEFYIVVRIWRIVYTAVLIDTSSKKCPNFLILLSKAAKNHTWNKLKSYKKAPISTQGSNTIKETV